MPVLERDNIASRNVSFASDSLFHDQIQIDQPDSDQNIEDGTGRRFKIIFQENRLRFDQTFLKGLDLRLSQSEFEIVLEQINREFLTSLEKSQKSVRIWSVVVAGTAPIALGFFLSAILARRVNRHQRALKMFWLALRTHLKNLNREIYFARGVEWRIERDMEKMTKRNVYNKLHTFNIEIVFRKVITLRPMSEAIRHQSSILTNTSRNHSVISSNRIQSRFSCSNLDDADLFALLSTGPDGENYNYISQSVNAEDNCAGVIDINSVRTVLISPFQVPDHVVVEDSNELETKDDLLALYNEIDGESLLVMVEEPIDVARARIQSTFEPPSAIPDQSVFTSAKELNDITNNPTAKITFVDLLRISANEDKNDRNISLNGVNEMNARASALAAITEEMATSVLIISESNSDQTEISKSLKVETADLEEIFAKRQLKKFNRTPTLTNQLYVIPESPPDYLSTEDPTGDAEKFLNTETDDDNDDVIYDLLKNDKIRIDDSVSSQLIQPYEDVGPLPAYAYPMADSFSALYETDDVIPINPIDSDENPDVEYTEIDGEFEEIRRKKWRVAPENAAKLSRVQTMNATVHPASRRSSYLPVTKNTSLPVNFGINYPSFLNPKI